MAYINKLFDENFLQYASYVIRDRAIPHLDDGLKPVQRRILHSLFEMDDGKFHKVANVVGHCMQYHPHGDASIFAALVNLANKDIFIERQGNFGNIYTGDPASAARYIECRAVPFGKSLLYNPEITAYQDSYDGRKKEPVTFPAKLPFVLALGSEGIAVGMATKILPHNLIEIMDAMRKWLNNEECDLYPDFLAGGLIDVSEYGDGHGKILSRARLDTSDPKRIIIKELPAGITTENLIASIESAARRNKIKVGAITDFTAEEVEVEIQLPRGLRAQDVIDGLYAFTDCEVSISVNLLVIRDEKPIKMTIKEVIAHHSKILENIIKQELELERDKLKERLFRRTLERIFIEERIYKRIETIKTQRGISKAVVNGLKPFADEINRTITGEDIEFLLKIPIRRISLYDIEKMKKEVEEIHARLEEIKKLLDSLTETAIFFLRNLIEKNRDNFPRKSEIVSLARVDIRDAAQKNLKLKYNPGTGYLGYEVNGGKSLLDVSIYDRVLVIRKNGDYSVINVPEKLFIGKGMLYCGPVDEETINNIIFTIVYKQKDSGYGCVKRFRINQFILNKNYTLVPEDAKLMKFTTNTDGYIQGAFAASRNKGNESIAFPLDSYLIKGVKAKGVRLKPKECLSVKFTNVPGEARVIEEEPELF